MIRTLILLVFLSGTSASAGEGLSDLLGKNELNKFETEGNWKLQEDGSVYLQPRPGEKGWQRYGSYLWLKGEYTDFSCEFEYRHEARGNSGFYCRVPDPAKPVEVGIEVQILDCFGKEKVGFHDLGGIIKFDDRKQGDPAVNAARPAGEWNKVSVTLTKDRLTVVINGKTVQDKVDLKKHKLSGGLAPKGRIGFQDHGQPFWLRNIRFKDLSKN